MWSLGEFNIFILARTVQEEQSIPIHPPLPFFPITFPFLYLLFSKRWAFTLGAVLFRGIEFTRNWTCDYPEEGDVDA